ncbi:hypothetical protein BHE74_00008327 [Ensete ventricosum]|nr:hypothetical protein BHE74_00008327 [Ensete ventricosum]
MCCNINRLLFFICDLFLILVDLLLHVLKGSIVGGAPSCSDDRGSTVHCNANKVPLSICHVVLLSSISLVAKDGWEQKEVYMPWCILKLNPRRGPMVVFELIVSLNSISFKVDDSDFYHSIIQNSVVAEITFGTQNPPRRVSFFPSWEVDPHVWLKHVQGLSLLL